MLYGDLDKPEAAFALHRFAFSTTSKALLAYGALMALALVLFFVISLNDERTIRDVGIWAKPMKFMAATALFAWTTVWLTTIAQTSVDVGRAFKWIAALIISTSLFEVVYITYQASHGVASHYNTNTLAHALLFGVMALAAFALTASQAWLAWEIWNKKNASTPFVITVAVVTGLTLTFMLSTVSGFMLGASQPPSGQGLPVLGWHMRGDIRPAHFLGVHAQQFIPLLGLFGARYLGKYAMRGFITGSALYVLAWIVFIRTSVS
jgi:hypothetical protein